MARRTQARQALGLPAEPTAEPDGEETTLVLAHWVFAGVGLTPGETWLASAVTPAPGTEGEPT